MSINLKAASFAEEWKNSSELKREFSTLYLYGLYICSGDFSMFDDPSVFKRRAKQVIVMRKDLNMRKGKMVAQGAHASLKAILDNMNMHPTEEPGCHEKTLYLYDGEPLMDWIEGIFTKVCVSVDSLDELLYIYSEARLRTRHCALIQDAGLTEFNGILTYTCCAIGPLWEEDANELTGHLKLL